MQNENHRNKSDKPRKTIIEKPLGQGGSLVAIYTGLLILLKMRQELGLEAMLGYMDRYARIIGGANPHIQAAVRHALQTADIPKIYREAMGAQDE